MEEGLCSDGCHRVIVSVESAGVLRTVCVRFVREARVNNEGGLVSDRGGES